MLTHALQAGTRSLGPGCSTWLHCRHLPRPTPATRGQAAGARGPTSTCTTCRLHTPLACCRWGAGRRGWGRGWDSNMAIASDETCIYSSHGAQPCLAEHAAWHLCRLVGNSLASGQADGHGSACACGLCMQLPVMPLGCMNSITGNLPCPSVSSAARACNPLYGAALITQAARKRAPLLPADGADGCGDCPAVVPLDEDLLRVAHLLRV